MTDKKLTESEAEKIIIELAKQGITSEKIGLMLKKDYKIINFEKEFKKKISQVLKENNIYVSPDKRNLSLQIEKLKKHFSKNKKDQPTKRILLIQEAKLRKLEKLGY
jgi:small subunit ribosomal protein S15